MKLIYLEMFGYDMSWASFHVLEVMSSPKYLQKRVGYLGAVQSFRPDTEVLMLATNMLKKVRLYRRRNSNPFHCVIVEWLRLTLEPLPRTLYLPASPAYRFRSSLYHTSSHPHWPFRCSPTFCPASHIRAL